MGPPLQRSAEITNARIIRLLFLLTVLGRDTTETKGTNLSRVFVSIGQPLPHRHRRVAVAAFRQSDGVGMECIDREQRRSRGSRLRMLLYPLLIGVCLWRSKTLSQPLDYNIFLLHPNVSQRPTLPLKLNKTCWENGLAYMFSGPQYPAHSKWSPLAFIFEGLNFFRVFVLLKFHFFNNLNDCEIKSTYLLILLLFLIILMVALWKPTKRE